MTKPHRRLAGLMAFLALSATPVVSHAAPAAPETSHASSPQGGITVMATFSIEPYTYPTYREAVQREIPAMEKKGLKLVKAYRVLAGDMDKYVDIWWAPDYDTFLKAFYDDEALASPQVQAYIKANKGSIKEPKVEIVREEAF